MWLPGGGGPGCRKGGAVLGERWRRAAAPAAPRPASGGRPGGRAAPSTRAVRSPERAAPGQEAAEEKEEEEGEGAGPERAHPAAARSPAAPGARA